MMPIVDRTYNYPHPPRVQGENHDTTPYRLN